MEKLKKWKVCICPKCGEVQVTFAKGGLRCRRCGSYRKFRIKGEWRVKLWDFDNERQARYICQKVKEKLDKNKKKIYH